MLMPSIRRKSSASYGFGFRSCIPRGESMAIKYRANLLRNAPKPRSRKRIIFVLLLVLAGLLALLQWRMTLLTNLYEKVTQPVAEISADYLSLPGEHWDRQSDDTRVYTHNRIGFSLRLPPGWQRVRSPYDGWTRLQGQVELDWDTAVAWFDLAPSEPDAAGLEPYPFQPPDNAEHGYWVGDDHTFRWTRWTTPGGREGYHAHLQCLITAGTKALYLYAGSGSQEATDQLEWSIRTLRFRLSGEENQSE